jgi:N-methylhydantoinase A/oxoprolinase/acetone carboxylase beta subunit
MPDALAAMERAWVDKVADSIRRFTEITPDTTLAAFGGGGPLLICDVADRLGVRKVIVPALAAVFSAFGLGFSDIAHHYEAVVPEGDVAGLDALVASLLERARRDMYAEGFELEHCEQAVSLLRIDATGEAHPLTYQPGQAPDVHLAAGEHLTVSMRVTKPIEHVAFEPVDVGTASEAVAAGTRRVCLPGDDARDIPLVRIADNAAGASGPGPAVIEEDFFTCRVPAGWRYRFAGGMDLVLEKAD